jgi:hypothetical protein
MEISSVDPTINQTTSVDEEDTIPEINRENTTHMIRESQATKTPYRHPNHKSRYLNQVKISTPAQNKNN